MLQTNSVLCSMLLIVIALVNSAIAQDRPSSALIVDKTEAENWREDLRYMAEQMPIRHKNLFHTMTRAQFDEAVKKLDERIPTLARHQIIVAMARIVAMVGDGHTNIAPTRDPKIGFRPFPLKLYFFKDGLYVRAGSREHSDVVGARIVKIGNVSTEQAYDAVRGIIGRDNEMDAKFFSPHLLVMPEILHALGLIDNMEEANFVVEIAGKQMTVELSPAGPAELLPPDTDTTWLSKPDWVDAREGAKQPTPLWLKDPQNKFWFEYIPGSKTVYVQFNQVGNKDGETIEAFSSRLVAFVEANPIDRFVLDLRLNRGGNGGLNRPLLRGIIKSNKIDQRGKLFTIVGRSTWSAAQFLVNELERYTNTIFVGEPTGGKVNSYGDSRKITLPNSGITVRVSTLWWQRDERDTRQWTAPEIAADLSFEDYRKNIDTALEAVLSYVPQKPLPEILMEALSGKDHKLVTERFRTWKSDPINEYADVESQLNSLGYQLLAAKRMNDAITIFKLNAEAYPRSANAFDSLAEAYMNGGNKELAIQNYEKALQLDPKMESAVEALKKLRGQ